MEQIKREVFEKYQKLWLEKHPQKKKLKKLDEMQKLSGLEDFCIFEHYLSLDYDNIGAVYYMYTSKEDFQSNVNKKLNSGLVSRFPWKIV
jgi:hypothetical protein